MKNSHEGQRIYHEVLRGIKESPTDTAEEREYRANVAKELRELLAAGGEPELWDEFP